MLPGALAVAPSAIATAPPACTSIVPPLVSSLPADAWAMSPCANSEIQPLPASTGAFRLIAPAAVIGVAVALQVADSRIEPMPVAWTAWSTTIAPAPVLPVLRMIDPPDRALKPLSAVVPKRLSAAKPAADTRLTVNSATVPTVTPSASAMKMPPASDLALSVATLVVIDAAAGPMPAPASILKLPALTLTRPPASVIALAAPLARMLTAPVPALSCPKATLPAVSMRCALLLVSKLAVLAMVTPAKPALRSSVCPAALTATAELACTIKALAASRLMLPLVEPMLAYTPIEPAGACSSK